MDMDSLPVRSGFVTVQQLSGFSLKPIKKVSAATQ